MKTVSDKKYIELETCHAIAAYPAGLRVLPGLSPYGYEAAQFSSSGLPRNTVNMKGYVMTFNADSDANALPMPKTAPQLFPSSDADLAGIRVTRAQFSRMMGVSKQAVTDWVKSGRIVVGVDGRFDPRVAVDRLISTGDPARLRAKILAPLVADVGTKDKQIAELMAKLGQAQEDAEFHEGSASELLEIFSALKDEIADGWDELREAPGNAGLSAIIDWLDDCLKFGSKNGSSVLDFLAAPLVAEGEGEARFAADGDSFGGKSNGD